MKLDSNTIILIVVTLLVAAGAYWYFFTGTGNQPPVSATTSASAGAQSQFETLVEELAPVTFDTSIFTDPRWGQLVDISTQISPEPVGRTDPFAPIGAASKSQ